MAAGWLLAAARAGDEGGVGPSLVVLALAVGLLWLNLWRALVFFRPSSVQVEADEPPGAVPVPAALEPAHAALVGLGFTPLGTHVEHPRLGRRLLSFDLVLQGQPVFASLFPGRGGRARLLLVSPGRAGGFVVTADHPRPAREVPGVYFSGAVPDAAPERLLNVHQRRLAELGPGTVEPTLEGRVALAQAWYRGAGATELRLQSAVGVLWTLGALGLALAALVGKEG